MGFAYLKYNDEQYSDIVPIAFSPQPEKGTLQPLNSPDPELVLFSLQRLEGVPASVEGICSDPFVVFSQGRNWGPLMTQLILDPSAPREEPLRKACGGFLAPQRGISWGPGNCTLGVPASHSWRTEIVPGSEWSWSLDNRMSFWKCLAPKVSWETLSARARMGQLLPSENSLPSQHLGTHSSHCEISPVEKGTQWDKDRENQPGISQVSLLTSRLWNEVKVQGKTWVPFLLTHSRLYFPVKQFQLSR